MGKRTMVAAVTAAAVLAAAGCGGAATTKGAAQTAAAHPRSTTTLSIPPQTFAALPTTSSTTLPYYSDDHPFQTGPVVVTAGGSGQGTVTMSNDFNAQSFPIVHLPVTYHVQVPDHNGFRIEVDGTGPVTCSITIPDQGTWYNNGDGNTYCNTAPRPRR